jgi:hypothetical protein
MPHFEKVTQIKADYPVAIVIGGRYGVNHARKTSSHQTGPFPLQESRTEREAGHFGRVHQDNRLQKPEIRSAYP